MTSASEAAQLPFVIQENWIGIPPRGHPWIPRHPRGCSIGGCGGRQTLRNERGGLLYSLTQRCSRMSALHRSIWPARVDQLRAIYIRARASAHSVPISSSDDILQ